MNQKDQAERQRRRRKATIRRLAALARTDAEIHRVMMTEVAKLVAETFRRKD